MQIRLASAFRIGLWLLWERLRSAGGLPQDFDLTRSRRAAESGVSSASSVAQPSSVRQRAPNSKERTRHPTPAPPPPPPLPCLNMQRDPLRQPSGVK